MTAGSSETRVKGIRQADELTAIADRLERYAVRLERGHDSRCVFTRIYALMTVALRDSLVDVPWSDAEWAVSLAAAFSRRYFTAIDVFDSGGDPGPAWNLVQTTIRQKRSSVLQDLLAGMAGHIVHDLPYALCDVRLAAAGGESHVYDYHRVNDVLGRAIEPLRRAVERRYNPRLRWLDWLGRRNEDILTDYGIRLSRAAAWYNACRLLDPASQGAAEASLERSPVAFLDELFRPPFPVVRLVVRAIDVTISLGRRWPRPRALERSLPVETPNQRYYFGVGVGQWRGVFRYGITDWKSFGSARVGLTNRVLAVGMAALLGVFRKATIESVIEGYPDQGPRGVATNLVRIHLFGVTLYLLREQYSLAADGQSVWVRSYERFGPVSFLFNVEKAHPARITDGGMHATYYIPLLGADWVGEYTVRPDRKHIESVLTCAWARAEESIQRVATAAS